MELYQPQFLNEQGGRANNEDSVFPTSPSEHDRLFLVCDGVGGQHKGEVASKLVCKYTAQYFSEQLYQWNDPSWMPSALRFVEQKLQDHLQHYPECQGMATTLALLYLRKDLGKAMIAWIGDSRVYHIRDGSVLFQSKDHSYVQSLLDMGEITETEAAIHPKRNMITRAINGTRETRIDQHVIHEILADDYFFLCSDGILENVNISEMTKWFTSDHSPADIRTWMLNNAEGKTSDNFSMYIVKVKPSDQPDQA